MSDIPELLTDRLVFRNYDCNRSSTDELGNKIYYKFFNEWWGVKQVKVEGKVYNVHRNAYDGIVSLVRAGV